MKFFFGTRYKVHTVENDAVLLILDNKLYVYLSFVNFYNIHIWPKWPKKFNNVSEWGDMSISGLLFQWASTLKIQLRVLVQYKVDVIIISLKINLLIHCSLFYLLKLLGHWWKWNPPLHKIFMGIIWWIIYIFSIES